MGLSECMHSSLSILGAISELEDCEAIACECGLHDDNFTKFGKTSALESTFSVYMVWWICKTNVFSGIALEIRVRRKENEDNSSV